MDISNSFKSEVFRPIVITLIPGGFALLPYGALGYLCNNKVATYFESHQSGVMILYAFLSIAVGLILEDFGSRIEAFYDRIANKPDSTHIKDWNTYLRTYFDKEPIGVSYIKSLVLRLKFELSFSLSIFVFLIGFCILNSCQALLSCKAFCGISIALLALAIYLLYESFTGSMLLGKVRKNLLSGVNCI